MKTYGIMWDEKVRFSSYVEIEANSEAEALKKWEAGDFDEYDRDERSNSFDKTSVEIKEIKE